MSEINTPTNYHDFRKNFLEMAQAKGLHVQSIQIRGLSPSGRPLFIEIAHTVFNPNLPTLVHLSGSHGIEGFLGSAIQSEILKELDISHADKVNLVFVHALNAWGMAWYRRVNAHNVDLNRNFFPEGTERPMNEDFNLFAPLFEKRPEQKKWKIWKSTLISILRLGIRKSIEAIARGQYHLAESIFYGGTQNEPEPSEVLRILKSKFKQTKPMIVIDVHSGLGKFASENWLLDGKHSEQEIEFWKKHLERDVIDTRDDKKLYPASGLLSYGFRHTFSDRPVFYIFEEFGTRTKLSVFIDMIKEHKTFLKLKLDRARAFMMIESYFPYEKNWRSICQDAGKTSYFKILKGIESDENLR